MARFERGSAAARGALWLLLMAAVGCAQRKSGRRVDDVLTFDNLALSLASDGSGLVLGYGEPGTGFVEFPFDPAAASGDWFGAPETFLAQENHFGGQVVAGPFGRAQLLFASRDVGPTGATDLRTAARTAAGWGAASKLGRLDDSIDYALAGDGEGGALAAWIAPDGALFAAAAPPDGNFGAPQQLRDGLLGAAHSVRAALRPNGGVVAAIVPEGTDGDLQLFAFDLALGFVDLGLVDVAAVSLAEGAPYYVDVAIGPTGERAGLWSSSVLGEDRDLVQVRRHLPGSGWQAHEIIEEVGPLSSERQIRYLDDGRLALAWSDRSAARLRWSRSAAAGDWEPYGESSFSLEITATAESVVAFERDGALTMVHLPNAELGEPEVIAARETAAGVLSATLDIGGVGGRAQVKQSQLAAGGDAVVAVWLGESKLEAFVWLPPSADFTVEPAVPEPGVAALLDGAASRWRGSAPAELIEWEFDLDGDGSFQRTAQQLFHAFATEGLHEVGVRVTDEWGRIATAVKEVRVEAGGGPDVDPPWELVVTASGNGGVTSDLDSDQDGSFDIDCPADCEESYFDGTVVFLTPRPAAGHHFVRWEGLSTAFFDGDYGAEGCLVQMRADRAITAVFAAD
ncbi:MAG: PKD domain-containing protein [Planctomycetes bacterium]|nr:PKD domain-containing protein [Planctomycetota bacterium]